MSQNKSINSNSSFDGHDHNGLPPPSYIEATTASGLRSSPISPRCFEHKSTQNSIEQLLQRLPLQLQEARQNLLSEQKDDERLLIEQLTPYITEFIRRLPSSVNYPQAHQSQSSSELILFPEGVVPATERWVLSGLGQRKEHAAHVEVVEVLSPGKEKLEYLDWKRLMWWHKEDLASRLATMIRCYLEPEKNGDSKQRTSTENERDNGLKQKQGEAGFRYDTSSPKENKSPERPASHFFGRWKKTHFSSSHSHRAVGPEPRHDRPNEDLNDSSDIVKATVQAEEVTFRRENDMGLWESSSGWAIILTVTIAI